MYWGNGSAIGAANLDGGAPQLDYITRFDPMYLGGPISDVAVDASHLYWLSSFGIGRVNLDGPAVSEALVGPLPPVEGRQQLRGIAIDGSHLYWADRSGIGRANLDGDEPNGAFVTGLEEPCGVAVDAGHVYWVDQSGIGRANIGGGEAEGGLVASAANACGVAVDAHHVYWGDRTADGTIGRANLDGSEADDEFIAGLGGVFSVAVNSTHIFWTDRPNGMAYASVGRANLDGSGASRSWIAGDSFGIGGVAVDSRPAPPPILAPSRPVRFGKLRRNRRRGVAFLDVWVPERGELSVVSPRLGWEVLKGPAPPAWRGGSFRWRLKLWPGRKGRVARRIQRQLRRSGRAAVKLQVAYEEEGDFLPAVQERQLVLSRIRKRGRRHSKRISRHWRASRHRNSR